MNILLLIIILALIIMLILIVRTDKSKKRQFVKEFYSLGTTMTLMVNGKKGEKALDEAMKKVMNIDDKMSVFKDYSEISKINKNAGGKLQIVSEDTYFVIKKAIEFCHLSQGTFDITIRPIVGLWGIGSDNARIPSQIEIDNKLKLINYKDVVLDENSNSVGLKYKNQEIDLGGIAKGYAADQVKNIFLNRGIKSALINLGGNVFAMGEKTNGDKWKIGIQNPLSPRGEFVGIISIINKSVVTSGNYERYFDVEGKRLQHIIDPRTGFPSESKIISATIISDLSIDGDGLSTGVYILGLDKALSLIKSLDGIEAIFITEDKKISVTAGMKDNFKLCNEEFILDKRSDLNEN
ncbi:FAD:protein FMN transferase [Clostridium akagii]|uniref:FAD:protein FMN transferase n=1 Tax=Clostridium akagii TaxID=91623 RepID=UPI00047AECBC|nr:FAD:protein FMN transferase [Clostridium akagii]